MIKTTECATNDIILAERLIEKRETEFIEHRVWISQWVKKLMQNVKEMDSSLLQGVSIPEGNTAEELLPALFTKPFNLEAYTEQVKVVNVLQENLDRIGAERNRRALELLSEGEV